VTLFTSSFRNVLAFTLGHRRCQRRRPKLKMLHEQVGGSLGVGLEHSAHQQPVMLERTNNKSPNDELAELIVKHLKARSLTLEACVASHAHVDHVGAIDLIRLRCPRPNPNT